MIVGAGRRLSPGDREIAHGVDRDRPNRRIGSRGRDRGPANRMQVVKTITCIIRDIALVGQMQRDTHLIRFVLIVPGQLCKRVAYSHEVTDFWLNNDPQVGLVGQQAQQHCGIYAYQVATAHSPYDRLALDDVY